MNISEKIEHLPEDEIATYIEANLEEEEYYEYNRKDVIYKNLNLFQKKMNVIQKSINNIRNYTNVRNASAAIVNNEIRNVSLSLRACINYIYTIGNTVDVINPNHVENTNAVCLKFRQEGERLHIDFSELLPRRIKKGSPYTARELKAMYVPAFREHFKYGKHIIYSKKAVIIYTHVFENDSQFIDHDNFETKLITDLITSWMLLDDSSKHCSIFMDYKIGEKSHTEVDVIPESEFIEFVKNK